MGKKTLRSAASLALFFVLVSSIVPQVLSKGSLSNCYLLTDSAGNLHYLNASMPQQATISAAILSMSPECGAIVSTAFDNITNTIYATCNGPPKTGNYTKVYAFDLSGNQLRVLPDPLPLCGGTPGCKVSWVTFDRVRKTLYARLDQGPYFWWVPVIISWNATSNQWSTVGTLPQDCANPFSSFRYVSGVIDYANKRLIGNCEMNTIFDLDISDHPSSPAPREAFIWDVQDFSSPLFIFPSQYSQGSDLSSLAFVSSFLNDGYAPVTQSMTLDRSKLRKQKWNVAAGAATPRTYTPIASSFQSSSSKFSIVNFVTTESYSIQDYYLMVQLDYRQATVTLFPQLNYQPMTLRMQYQGSSPYNVNYLTGVHTLDSCPQRQQV